MSFKSVEETFVRNHVYFELWRKLEKNNIEVKNEVFTPFVDSLYMNEVKCLMKHKLDPAKTKNTMEKISEKIDNFVAKQLDN